MQYECSHSGPLNGSLIVHLWKINKQINQPKDTATLYLICVCLCVFFCLFRPENPCPSIRLFLSLASCNIFISAPLSLIKQAKWVWPTKYRGGGPAHTEELWSTVGCTIMMRKRTSDVTSTQTFNGVCVRECVGSYGYEVTYSSPIKSSRDRLF